MRETISRHEFGFDVAGTGFTVLDRIYANGDLTDVALGGSCGNVLVSLAMLDRRVAPVLVLGNDAAGEHLINEFFQAGAITRYIVRRSDLQSPVLAQELDTASGRHGFSFVCPETREDLPRYHPIGKAELTPAMQMLASCNVFYADRLSENILQAMRTANSSGAAVFFEPSDIEDEKLFDEALHLASILKYSQDRLGERLAGRSTDYIGIVTHGAAGLEVRDRNGEGTWCEAIAAPAVLDTCGSGDMVSVAVIDWILANRFEVARLKAADLMQGIIAGQRLAAENCAYAGARGVFKQRGADFVREILKEHPGF